MRVAAAGGDVAGVFDIDTAARAHVTGGTSEKARRANWAQSRRAGHAATAGDALSENTGGVLPDGGYGALVVHRDQTTVAAVAEQTSRHDMGFTLEAMQMPLEALGYEINETFPVLGVFDKGKVADRPEMIRTAEMYGEKLALEIK